MSGVKAKLKKSFWGNYLISCYHCLRCKISPKLISDEEAVKKYYKGKFGKELDLSNPQTFSEKINWYKIFSNDPLMAQCADKVAVRDYIIEKGYANSLNNVYGIYNNVSEIDPDNLPPKFVIKASHGSHMNYIVKDKNSFDWKKAKRMLRTWLHQDIYWSGREWVYKDIPKRIIIEEYLEDDAGELRDYKFFCFNGEPVYMEYDLGRFGKKHYRNFYDMQMNLMEFFDGECPQKTDLVEFPLKFEVYEQMQNMARVLSKPFQHVRVDFYYANNKIYCGELTFFDGGGSTVFYPEEWNYKFSEDWKIRKK